MRYEYIEEREEDQPTQYERTHRPKQKVQRPAQEDPYALDPRLAGVVKGNKPRVYQSGKINGVGVRVINVQEAIKNAMAIGIVLVCMFLFVVLLQHWWFGWRAGSYTYKAYRESIHSTIPACNMDGSLHGATPNGMILLCAESGKVPSKEQINQWQGFTLWQACYEYGDDNACNQLND